MHVCMRFCSLRSQLLVVSPQSYLHHVHCYLCVATLCCLMRSGKAVLRWVSLAANRFVLVTFIIRQFHVCATSYPASAPRAITVLLTSGQKHCHISPRSSLWTTAGRVTGPFMEPISQQPQQTLFTEVLSWGKHRCCS